MAGLLIVSAHCRAHFGERQWSIVVQKHHPCFASSNRTRCVEEMERRGVDMGADDDRDVAMERSWRSPLPVGGPEPSRREFLASIAAFGITTAVNNGSSMSQSTASNAKPQLIDVHHHIFPPEFLAA